MDWHDRAIYRSGSGHSARVGATQTVAALDIDLAAIAQAGGGNRRCGEIGRGEGGGEVGKGLIMGGRLHD